MMAVYLTGELKEHTKPPENAGLAFFFCSADDENRSTVKTVLRSLVHQILVKLPQLTRHALPDFETPKRTHCTISSLETS